MAAYAALVSLMNTMDQVQIHPRFSTSFNKEQVESLGDTVGFLLDFVESYDGRERSKQVEDLEAEIASAAHAAEDVIESHIVDLILAGSANSFWQKVRRKVKKLLLPTVICDLQKVIKDMDSIKEFVIGSIKYQQLTRSLFPQPPPPPPPPPPPRVASSMSIATGNPTMVGFDDYLIQLMDKLTWQQSHKQVIPIIGMGGIGKTTLARNAFENLLIKQHFDVRAWATISQNYSPREILLQILANQDQGGSRNFVGLNEQELGEQLHKYLFDRRYLIIMDDVWSIKVWDDIKFYFPDNNNGSRIVLTTRLHDISLHFNSPYLAINFLDKDKSWDLFCQESFGDEGCPAELEEVGNKICENCKGLPLSIVVIGGFLRKSSNSREYWEGIARDIYSILKLEGDNQCMNILSLSYKHLPAHLKPCFLYRGVFAEDDEILVSRLIKLWVAEGFIRPNDAQSLEEVAEGYLKDLVGRNLILVSRWGSNGKMRACNIHDLIRELCLSVAEKEKFLSVANYFGTQRAINKERRVVIHESMSNQKVSHALGSESLVRSLICKGHMTLYFKLLRVLCAVDEEPYKGFLEANLSRVNLRCLDHRFVLYDHNRPSLFLPKKISLLWNLQTVSINGYGKQIVANSQLWEMVQLKHLQVDDLYIPDPPRNDRVYRVLPNLQTLGNAMNFRLSEEVCKRIPNIKKLHLVYNELPRGRDAGSYYCPRNLGRFHKLESLNLEFEYLNWRPMVLNMTFPSSLKKLTLCGSKLYWEDMEMIGSLPNLEVLKLKSFAMIGCEWNPVEGEFRRLKFLQIHGYNLLTKWNADHFHFPVLEKLVLGLLFHLDEIPLGIGEIPTLRIIQLIRCSLSSSLSAVKILEEQESLGNDDLQVEVGFHIDDKMGQERFREMMEEDGFTSNNLHIKRVNS